MTSIRELEERARKIVGDRSRPAEERRAEIVKLHSQAAKERGVSEVPAIRNRLEELEMIESARAPEGGTGELPGGQG